MAKGMPPGLAKAATAKKTKSAVKKANPVSKKTKAAKKTTGRGAY